MDGACSVSRTTWTCNFSGSGGYLAQAVWDTSLTCNNGICKTRSHGVGSRVHQLPNPGWGQGQHHEWQSADWR